MFQAIPTNDKSKLWKHQRDALDFAVEHLNSLDSPCLIRMPTGTGKTGIIGCLTRMSNQGSTLVLTPWAHLRKQMISDIEKTFWQDRGITPDAASVVSIFPSNAKDTLTAGGKMVIVATFARLNQLRREHPDIYDKLSATISLVLVDEGHYEPAVEWGKSVKELNRRTILLTATPYRNDLKLFRITDPQRSTNHFTHADAVKSGIIRKLRCEELDSTTDIESLSQAFAKAWKEAKRNNSLASANPRAIICCSEDEDILTAVMHLQKAGLSVIGIHEQFEEEDDESLVKAVPDPKKEKAEIWVHQNKLTEGLDDHRFSCVALFTRIRNDRKLIQQIGRVLRRNSDDRNDTALLLAPKEFAAESEWNAYLEFETELNLLEPQHFRDVVDKLLGAQPNVEYLDGRFRRRFAPDALQHCPQVIIPPSVLVRSVGEKFSLEKYIEDCTETLSTADAVILGPEINRPCRQSDTTALWVYASVRNSRFLQNTSLYEIKLETHCVVLADGFVFMNDSSGNFPDEYIEDNTGQVPADQLARFLDREFRPTNVSVDSSLPYDTVLKGAELRGHNLLNIAASLTDRLHICRAARGTSRERGRRYVGMSNARLRKEVTEEERRSFEPEVFVSWAQEVAKILRSNVKSSPLFQRYMPVCEPPETPVPKTISLDMLRSDVDLALTDGKECYLARSSSEVNETAKKNRTLYTCTFGIEANEIQKSSISLRLDFQRKKRRYWFNKQSGAAIQVTVAGENRTTTKSLAEFLNGKQDIVLIGLE
jgi:superfamily II DNA or RNA helicase